MKPMKLGVDTYDMLDEKHNSIVLPENYGNVAKSFT